MLGYFYLKRIAVTVRTIYRGGMECSGMEFLLGATGVQATRCDMRGGTVFFSLADGTPQENVTDRTPLMSWSEPLEQLLP